MTHIPRRWHTAICAFLSVFLLDAALSFALDPRFEIDTKTLRPKSAQPSPAKPGSGTEAKPPSSGAKRVPAARDAKKAVDDLSGSRGAAKASTRAGHARSPKTIAPRTKARVGSHGKERRVSSRTAAQARGAIPTGFHTLQMTASPRTDHEAIRLTKNAWSRIMADEGARQAPLRVEGGNFSLSLDPERYPLLPAADGGKILIDAEGALPLYVKEILRDKEPGVRIVTEKPANVKRFFSALLAAARFYSVEEDFAVHLGTDPKVTVTSDFKIEKNQESLLNNDVFLVNVSEARAGLPTSLVSHLEKEGFHVVELSTDSQAGTPASRHVLYSITSETQQGVVDAILSAFSFTSVRDRDIELDDGSQSGVSLSVRADRSIETPRGRVLLSFSDANPVQYTLFKLLQLKGYQVVTIQPADDFRKVTEKVLSALKISASFGMHHLGSPRETPVDIQLSGFAVREPDGNSGNTFLTNVSVNSLVRELAGFKGYSVIDR